MTGPVPTWRKNGRMVLTVLSYDQSVIDQINPAQMFEKLDGNSNGFVLPGWEPERMAKIKELFELYRDVDEKSSLRT